MKRKSAYFFFWAHTVCVTLECPGCSGAPLGVVVNPRSVWEGSGNLKLSQPPLANPLFQPGVHSERIYFLAVILLYREISLSSNFERPWDSSNLTRGTTPRERTYFFRSLCFYFGWLLSLALADSVVRRLLHLIFRRLKKGGFQNEVSYLHKHAAIRRHMQPGLSRPYDANLRTLVSFGSSAANCPQKRDPFPWVSSSRLIYSWHLRVHAQTCLWCRWPWAGI